MGGSYVLTRDRVVLYVGISGEGVSRPLARDHHALGGVRLGPRDRLIVRPVEDEPVARNWRLVPLLGALSLYYQQRASVTNQTLLVFRRTQYLP